MSLSGGWREVYRRQHVDTQPFGDLGSKVGHVIGVDAEGEVHVHYGGRVAVYAVSEDWELGDLTPREPVAEHELNGRPIEHWLLFVDERRGWEQLTDAAPDFGGSDE